MRMINRISVALLFGGRSCEHQVSVTSAKSVLAAIDKNKYAISLIGIDPSGGWVYSDEGSIDSLIEEGTVRADKGVPVTLDFAQSGVLLVTDGSSTALPKIDLFFPVLHGTYGEDGTLQGLLEMVDVPYVGCGVAASANGMDKVIAKQLFELAGIPQNAHQVVQFQEWQGEAENLLDQAEAKLRYPLFVKPANMGSSVGISKAFDRDSLSAAIDEALRFDNKVLVEAAFENGHEVECAVLGNDQPQASVVGEIDAGAEFYDYDAKYVTDSSRILIPAPIPATAAKQVRDYAIRAFKAIDGSGLARVDFFVGRDSGRVVINEINTLPGFTPISMYPKMWAESGLSYPDLIDKLISLAIARYGQKQRLKRAF